MIDWLITFLQDYKASYGKLSDFSLLVTVLVPFLSAVGTLMIFSSRFAKRRYMADLKEAEEIRHKLAAREDSIRDLKSELEANQTRIAALEAKGAEFFLDQMALEARDGNFEREVHLSQAYLTDQKAALSSAFQALMEDAIENAALEGAPGYANARLYALAGLALRKDDVDLRDLADQLRAAEAAAASGVTVRLKTQENEVLSDLDALAAAYKNAWLAGRYRLAMELTKHGLRAAMRQGPNAMELSLRWRNRNVWSTLRSGYAQNALHKARALLPDQERVSGINNPHTHTIRYLIACCLLDTGEIQKALEEAKLLLSDQERMQGIDHPHTLTTRNLIVDCLINIGQTQMALEAAKTLLPDQERVNGGDDTDTLTTRYLIAWCLKDIGETQKALEAAKALLPDEERVNGKDHPNTLTTRYLIATCLKDTGETDKALEAAKTLLPEYEKVQGLNHPHTLTTRYLIASCLKDLGETETALEEAKKLLVEFPLLVGELHPRTLRVKTLAACCLLDLDQPDEADEIHADVVEQWHKLGVKETEPDVQCALKVDEELAKQACDTSAEGV